MSAVPPKAMRPTTRARALSGFVPVVGIATFVVGAAISTTEAVGPSLIGASAVVVEVDADIGSVVVVDGDSYGLAAATATAVTEAVPSQ